MKLSANTGMILRNVKRAESNIKIVNDVSNNSLKKNKVKLDLLTDIDMILMMEKGIRGAILRILGN